MIANAWVDDVGSLCKGFYEWWGNVSLSSFPFAPNFLQYVTHIDAFLWKLNAHRAHLDFLFISTCACVYVRKLRFFTCGRTCFSSGVHLPRFTCRRPNWLSCPYSDDYNLPDLESVWTSLSFPPSLSCFLKGSNTFPMVRKI